MAPSSCTLSYSFFPAVTIHLLPSTLLLAWEMSISIQSETLSFGTSSLKSFCWLAPCFHDLRRKSPGPPTIQVQWAGQIPITK
ncbi:hypothetical protein FB45DRAFT_480796 [Roridomyces roridus]|uniref:Uncharacterized protein n=1 Tax=Roridomyces roridus TaxID=1738132 RepID=A0AAD7BZU6_9AGAR|nr:hypothetical protein FB45DRAFT_480796 [Roridomyces roridus]